VFGGAEAGLAAGGAGAGLGFGADGGRCAEAAIPWSSTIMVAMAAMAYLGLPNRAVFIVISWSNAVR
jgi:hypothetical protein